MEKYFKSTYCYIKNVKVNFEWLILANVYFEEDGTMVHGHGKDFLPASKPFDLETEIFEPTIEDQLEVLDTLEKEIQVEAANELDKKLNEIKNRRAALLSLPFIQPAEDNDIPF